MGAPYIARAPKKVLVRIPRNEGYTTVPSGMATLRLIPSPLDKPATQDSTEGSHGDHPGPPPRVVGASPLDRPQQFTTGVVPPPPYTRNIHTEPAQALNSQHSSPASGVNSGALGPLQQQQQLGHRGTGGLVSTSSSSEADSSRSTVVLQGPPRGQQAVYQQEQRSSSPGHGPGGGHLAAALAAAAATAGATIAARSPGPAPAGGLLHYQGHFTAISGRGGCQQDLTTAGRSPHQQQQQQLPPPFTDFIAGQVWRALMMASQQQQQQHQQQVSGGVVRGGQQTRGSGVGGGKRSRDMATTTTVASMEGADTDEGEPTRKMSRTVTQAQHGPLQDTAPAVLYSPAGPGSTTTFHSSSMPPTPPSTPPTTQQQTYSSTRLDGPALHLAVSSCPKRGGLVTPHPQQPLVPLSPPALHLPIMFPPVFPQSMTSIKGPSQQQQQFSLRSSSSSGPVAVSGSGGGGGLGLGEAPPHHLHHHQASQLTVGPLLSPQPPTNPLSHPQHRLSHHHPPTAALLQQPTHGGQPAAHVELPPSAAAAAPTPMATVMLRMTERSGQEQQHQQGGPGGSTGVLAPAGPLYRAPLTAAVYSNRHLAGKTSSSSRSTSVPTQQQADLPCHPTVVGAAAAVANSVVVNSDTNTTTSHCST